jgi:hypothetical protein
MIHARTHCHHSTWSELWQPEDFSRHAYLCFARGGCSSKSRKVWPELNRRNIGCRSPVRLGALLTCGSLTVLSALFVISIRPAIYRLTAVAQTTSDPASPSDKNFRSNATTTRSGPAQPRNVILCVPRRQQAAELADFGRFNPLRFQLCPAASGVSRGAPRREAATRK